MFSDDEQLETSRVAAELRAGPGHRVLLIGPRSEDIVYRLLGATGGAAMSIVDSCGATTELGWSVLDDNKVNVSECDGYDGAPGAGPFDRIACMAGIAGVPAAWIEQLAPDGVILAPLALAGTHPLFAITVDPERAGTVWAELRVVGDSEVAGTRLRPPRLFVCEDDLPDLRAIQAEAVDVMMSPREYEDFRVFAGTREPNILACRPPGSAGRDVPLCALVDPAWGAAWIRRNGAITLSGKQEVRDRLAALALTWHDAGRPAAEKTAVPLRWSDSAELWLPDWRSSSDDYVAS